MENFVAAALIVTRTCPQAQFVIVAGAGAFMPEHADELQRLARSSGGRITFVISNNLPNLLVSMDIFCWLPQDKRDASVVAEAGAAGLPVVAPADNDAGHQIADGNSGISVPQKDPGAVADAMLRLVCDALLRKTLGYCCKTMCVQPVPRLP